jgi:WD40 repeat protein
MCFWDAKGGADLGKNKGLLDGQPMTSFSCVAWDDKGHAYTGGANSKIYVWNAEGEKDRNCTGTISVHKGGFICSIIYTDCGKLLSGGKDGDVHEIDVAGGTSIRHWSFDNLVRAVDLCNGNLLVGLRDGTIWLRAEAD